MQQSYTLMKPKGNDSEQLISIREIDKNHKWTFNIDLAATVFISCFGLFIIVAQYF